MTGFRRNSNPENKNVFSLPPENNNHDVQSDSVDPIPVNNRASLRWRFLARKVLGKVDEEEG